MQRNLLTMFENQNLISDSDDESSLLITGSDGVQQSRQRPGNNSRKSICWNYFKLIEVSENETVVKCIIEGCNTKYIWRGSTSNLLGHIKRRHQNNVGNSGVQLSRRRRRSRNNYRKAYVGDIFAQLNRVMDQKQDVLLMDAIRNTFIVPSASPLKVINSLKSSDHINLQIELPLDEQINKLYKHLSDRLKSKVQKAKSIMLSIYKIYSEFIKTFEDIIEALDQWKLKNLKFISNNKNFYDQLKEKYPDIIHISTNVNESSDSLIAKSLKRWDIENTSTQGISNIAIAVKNATENLCNVKLFNNYNNDSFIGKNVDDFKRDLLDNLPVSIFYILVELFKPLKHIEVVTERNVTDLLVKATNILSEISQFTFDMEYKTLESFLKFLIRSYRSYFYKQVSLFLDPRLQPINFLSDELGKFVLDKYQAYYSQNPSSSDNNLAFEELTKYISRTQYQSDENIDVYKWWQNSKHEFPGLATLAREYSPFVSDKVDKVGEVQLNNLKNFIEIYQNDDMIDKTAFLDCNMKHINL
ncbi:27077_t:CDS:2 [Dentiscutata erythropus]|uniref:27077_t:CDS:1 n=1 Tax=Dentiscutata erythropus TaxID=1348616 RepID=A0A9N9ABD2_9GLOM|nr:27077_t:CDS:2 [Dentiscutata erythropus]